MVVNNWMVWSNTRCLRWKYVPTHLRCNIIWQNSFYLCILFEGWTFKNTSLKPPAVLVEREPQFPPNKEKRYLTRGPTDLSLRTPAFCFCIFHFKKCWVLDSKFQQQTLLFCCICAVCFMPKIKWNDVSTLRVVSFLVWCSPTKWAMKKTTDTFLWILVV